MTALGIIILGAVIYSNAVTSPFHYDDVPSIERNQSITDLSDIKAVWDFWPTRFITYLSFAVNYRIGRLDTFGYHIVNIAIHIMAALCLWRLLLITFRTPRLKSEQLAKYGKAISAWVALIFVAHPIQTQAVTYIVQRAAALATLFYIISILFYARYRMRRGKHDLAISVASALLAVFSKEMAITLPAAIILYEYLFFHEEGRPKWTLFAPYVAIAALSPVVMFTSGSIDLEKMSRATEEATRIPAANYAMTQANAIATYLRLLVLPVGQNLDYDYHIVLHPFETGFIASVIIISLVVYAAAKSLKDRRLIAFGILFFFLALIPESSIVPIKDVVVEHRLYLPMIAFASVLAASVFYWPLARRRGVAALLLGAFVAYLALFTYARNIVWQEKFSLWDDVIKKSPNKGRPYGNRGVANLRAGRYDDAIADFNKCLELAPNYPKAYYNRANAYVMKRDYRKALSDYSVAIIMKPDYSEAYYNRGDLLSSLGEYADAAKDFTAAIKINPRNVKAYNGRGISYAAIGEHDKAITDFSEAIRLKPLYAEAYYNRALAYKLAGDPVKALSDLKQASKQGIKVDRTLYEELSKEMR